MRSWPFYFKTEVILGNLYTIFAFCRVQFVCLCQKNTTIPPHSVEVKIKGKKTVFRFYRFRIRRFFGFDFKQNRPSLAETQTRIGFKHDAPHQMKCCIGLTPRSCLLSSLPRLYTTYDEIFRKRRHWGFSSAIFSLRSTPSH